MTNEEFFALHPQPELVVGHAYPTLIFPEEEEDDTSIYVFPSKPEKYKRQYAVDLTDIPKNLLWEFDKVVVEEEEKEDLSDLPDLISNEECNAAVYRARLNQKQTEESYWASLTTFDEVDEEIQKSLSRQYNLVEIIKENKKYEEEERMQEVKKVREERNQIKKAQEERNQIKKVREERMQEVKKVREERNQIINDGEMRRFSIRQDKEEQERVQAIKDRELRCFRTLENARNAKN